MTSAGAAAVKVLLCGDVLGGFSALLKKVSAVNAKAGPFELLLCVGQFFAEGGAFLCHHSCARHPKKYQTHDWIDRLRVGAPSLLLHLLLLLLRLLLLFADDGGDVPDTLLPFVTGEQQLPVRTYFIGGYGACSPHTALH
jgi:hypothetical protein